LNRSLTFVRGLVPALLLAAVTGGASAQQVLTAASSTIRVEVGKTAIVRLDYDAERVSVADSTVVDLVLLDSPREFLINGLAVGSTSLIVWDAANVPQIFEILVVADATALQSQMETLFPGAGITVASTGQAVIVSGTVRDPVIARRALDLASQSGAQVINNLQQPPPQQILLRVRFAEIRRNARTRLGTQIFADNVAEMDQLFGDGSTATIETISDGIARLFLIGQNAELDVQINAMKSRGEFRNLAEPNLITIEGTQASFLAGGEFPYPVVQQGGENNGVVTIQFKEFGVRLTFTPTVTNSGSIRLRVQPEVSSLDFANGVTFSGFQVPSLLTRRADTEVELAPGQHLALAGLLDNSIQDNVDKIPLLGDLPILGAFFRSKSNLQGQTELLVLVTPMIVQPSDVPPAIPTGEPGSWKWDRSMRIDTTRTGGANR
jgi:pilus assembly protein CpaC